MNDQKENTGYFTDLQGGLMLIDSAHNNTFRNDTFNAPGSAPLQLDRQRGEGVLPERLHGLGI